MRNIVVFFFGKQSGTSMTVKILIVFKPVILYLGIHMIEVKASEGNRICISLSLKINKVKEKENASSKDNQNEENEIIIFE